MAIEYTFMVTEHTLGEFGAPESESNPWEIFWCQIMKSGELLNGAAQYGDTTLASASHDVPLVYAIWRRKI